MKSPELSIIIVSYNTEKLTLATIASVFQSLETGKLKQDQLEIIVVDNHSSDNSVKVLRQQFGSKITLIENPTNSGFAQANNLGVSKAGGEYVLLLNSDTLVEPQSLDLMLSAFKSNAKLGICSASLVNPDGSYQPQGGNLPTLTNVAAWWLWPFSGIMPLVEPYQDPRKLNSAKFINRGWVGGTAMMLKRDLYEELGGLDEKIFMYAEDVDLCRRIKDRGFEVGIATEAKIIHIGSASGSSLRARLGEVNGLKYYFHKHGNILTEFCLNLILLKGALLRYLYFGILKGDAGSRELYGKILCSSKK